MDDKKYQLKPLSKAEAEENLFVNLLAADVVVETNSLDELRRVLLRSTVAEPFELSPFRGRFKASISFFFKHFDVLIEKDQYFTVHWNDNTYFTMSKGI